MFEYKEDDKRKLILGAKESISITGGPGSGKTTIALLKAKQIVESGELGKGQKVLFLSFARATITRIEDQVGELVPSDIKTHIEIATYHSFMWSIIKHHGYLINEHPIRLWSPYEAAARLSSVVVGQRKSEIEKAFENEGLIHFDLFAEKCNQLLRESNSIRRLISNVYPTIILDEFQDTNQSEWDFIQFLGMNSRLITLADPYQRIFDFRGADPGRVKQFIEVYKPLVVDLGDENNRSCGTDIVQFGNDLLSGKNRTKKYKDVVVYHYEYRSKPFTHSQLKYIVLKTCERLSKTKNEGWSIAVLVPTNLLMLSVSDAFQKAQKMSNGQLIPKIRHEVAIETAGPAIAASFLAVLLEKGSEKEIISSLVEHICGRCVNRELPKTSLSLASALKEYLDSGKARGKVRIETINECKDLADKAREVVFSGNVIADWKTVLALIASKQSNCICQLANDLRYLRLLQRGSRLYSSLDELWRKTHSYKGAKEAINDALVQDSFSADSRKWSGVNVMTFHKAKGKEFDEVIIYEGLYQDRIVSKPERIEQAKLNLRVAVTRARERTTILSPKKDPCILL